MKKTKLKVGTERIEFFSDAVIAIIMTLMVLEIHPPEFEDGATSAQIFHQLAGIVPNILAFMISFASLGVYWVNHHQFFKSIAEADWKLLYYNLHFLFWCSLIPFTTALLAEHYENPVVTALYGTNMLFSGAAFGLMYRHTLKKGLSVEHLSSKLLRKITRTSILSLVLSVISIFAGFISVYISIVIFALVPALHFFPHEVELEIGEME